MNCLLRDVNKLKKEAERLKQNIAELEETREKLYKQIDFYRMTAKWHFEPDTSLQQTSDKK